ncbi:hypothetical protein HYPSUDRAFT_36406 [Hypholoma sublateritium FD-334 SS-4]|uniref:Uncharacterized protein n=1 Tax=Hypholoma sublateritium (strain FD-334 SS-4) TaxID=945553 RepID=A0A0D2MRV5_HYPSF|nr:hypothetical protein HYPSUDRAFT_36406 [Hypholoma sublateritium FD-334 SS-4]
MNVDSSSDSDMESDVQTCAASSHQSEDMMDTTSEDLNSHLWGYLQPCNPVKPQIDFWRLQACITIGRAPSNQIVFDGSRISMHHCTITWDGNDGDSGVVVCDLSTNGTFINGTKLGRNQTRILRDRDEVAFGSSVIHRDHNGEHDYRYIYRHVARAATIGLFTKYDLGNLLGRGAFGTVYRLLHRSTGKWFAVKMVDLAKFPKEGDGKTTHEKIVREIAIMEGLKHPNVCQIHDTFFEKRDSTVNLVLEFVDGGDLWDYINKTENGLGERRTQDIIYQICDAMKYVHSEGITHRDLKPENILLTSHDYPIVKVADFGLSKAVDHMTMLRSFCGTPVYLAPEVFTSSTTQTGYDNRVDCFSVGGVVFLCMTKEEPFVVTAKISERDTEARVKTRTRNSYSLTDINASESVIDFVNRMLDDNPRRRPSMAEALEHPWLMDYEPYHGVAQLEEEDPKVTDTDEETARENEEDTQTLTRAMAKAKMQMVKGKGRATGGKLLFYPRMKLKGEGSSGSSLDADTNVPPTTPRRRTRRNQSPESPKSVRRSQRTNKGLRRL